MTDTPKEFDRIVTLWAGGEHLRAAALAAEEKFSAAKLDELSILCPGIKDHMPGRPGEVRNTGTVPGNPVESEMKRMRVDEAQVDDFNRQRKDEGTNAKEALAKADPQPAGTPSNDGIDKPTLHPEKHSEKSDTKPTTKAK